MTDQPSQPATDDWRHLTAYGYAPGGYMCRCSKCGGTPINMDKRATTCRPCAEEMCAAALAARPALGPDEFIGKAKINGHWYGGKHMIRVAQITYDGSTCTVPLSALVDMLGDGETYQVRVTSMRKAEFDRLEEFAGW